MTILGKEKFTKYVRLGLLLLVALACMMAFVLIQPFGDGPDEIDRYKVVQFIVNHGTLPHGGDPEVLIGGYGGSYAFQPILTYMIQGYLLRGLSFLHLSFDAQLIIARMICVVMGLVAAVYTYLIAAELFTDEKKRMLLTMAVVFLPQNIFIYTYVNTDSMGLLSVAMIIYAILRGNRTDYDKSSIVNISLGCIFCLMSYYNCYGAVLVAVICFFVRKPSELWKKFFTVAGVTFAGAGWWFIRNAVLYEGDFLALNARRISMAATGIAEVSPAALTCREMGMSVYEMIFGTEYFVFTWQSFIGKFGPMTVPTNHYVYMSHKYLFFFAVIGLLMVWRHDGRNDEMGRFNRIMTYIMMAVLIIIPSALAVFYSYTWDFQPQGRYYLPMVIPFMYICVIGLSRIIGFVASFIKIADERYVKTLETFAYCVIYLYLLWAVLISAFYMMPGYYGAYL